MLRREFRSSRSPTMNPIDGLRTRFVGSVHAPELREFLALEYPRESPVGFGRATERTRREADRPRKEDLPPRRSAPEGVSPAPPSRSQGSPGRA